LGEGKGCGNEEYAGAILEIVNYVSWSEMFGYAYSFSAFIEKRIKKIERIPDCFAKDDDRGR
jgi:hypothetical protein